MPVFDLLIDAAAMVGVIEERVFHMDVLLNEALDESFPASDPLSSLQFD